MARTEPRKILAVIEALTVTGPARNLLEFAQRARVPLGNTPPAEIEILTFARGVANDQHPDTAFLAAARAKGIRCHVVWEKGRFDRSALRQLRTKIASLNPDIVQTHGVKSHFLVSLARFRAFAPKWIAYHHGYTAEDAKMRLYNQLDGWSLPRADRVITVCTPFAKSIEKKGVRRDRLDVLSNSIDSRQLPAREVTDGLRAALGIDPSARVVLAVGRFSPEKGHLDLLQAWRAVLNKMPEQRLRLLLVGDGLLRSSLEEFARASGTLDSIVFAGHQKNVWDYYGVANLFVLPSHSEGSPNVLLEAMLAGLPIVSTEVGGVPDMVTDGESALVTPRRNPEAMAAALERLLGDPEYAARLGRTAAQRVREHFRPEDYQKSLLDIYSKALGEGPEL